MLKIIPIGGFSEVGRNSCAVEYDDEIVILDLGLHMEKYIEHTDSDDIVDLSDRTLMNLGAVPDVRIIDPKKVKAICISHAHLDHLGATPFLASRFDCPVYGSPFTINVLKAIVRDEKIDLPNKLIDKPVNSTFKVSEKITIEFISVTHSAPQALLIAIHTPEGTILYANDFKLDEHPTLGRKTNLERLEKMDVKALVVDCLYSTNPARTPSELIAKQMLKEILLHGDHKGKNIFVTTFSSHIARLKSITEIARKMGRIPIFMGRSLAKYSFAAEDSGITNFSEAEIVKYSSKVKRYLTNLKKTDKYLFVVTGHQGEPRAILSKIVNQNYFKFRPGDMVIFSCQIIPVPINYENREELEKSLKEKNVRIFRDVHVSGHASKEDQRDFFNIVKPDNIIPVHGDKLRMLAMKELALEEGYDDKNIHFLVNGQVLEFQ